MKQIEPAPEPERHSSRDAFRFPQGQAKGRGMAGRAGLCMGDGVVFVWGRGLQGAGLLLHIQQAAGQWAGSGRGAEGGMLPRPRNGILLGAELARALASRTSRRPWVRPASDRAAATTAAAALGKPGPTGAAGGGGARALDVPQRGGQREKGGLGGLGPGAAPLLMWRRVGGGSSARMERRCQGWRGWSWVGVWEQVPGNPKPIRLGSGPAQAISAKALKIGILEYRFPPKHGQGYINSRYDSLGKIWHSGSGTQFPLSS